MFILGDRWCNLPKVLGPLSVRTHNSVHDKRAIIIVFQFSIPMHHDVKVGDGFLFFILFLIFVLLLYTADSHQHLVSN